MVAFACPSVRSCAFILCLFVCLFVFVCVCVCVCLCWVRVCVCVCVFLKRFDGQPVQGHEKTSQGTGIKKNGACASAQKNLD